MHLKNIFKILVCFILVLILLSCTPKEAPSQHVSQGETSVLLSSTKEAWQDEWDKTLTQAKKEGKVVIYTTLVPAGREAWSKDFKNKFGIDLEFFTGRSAELSQKLLAERRAGIVTGDLFITGLTTLHLDLKPTGVFEGFEKQLFLPEVIDPGAWYGGTLPWFTQEKYIFIWRLYPTKNFWINTGMIKPGEIKSYRDLLKPQWSGGKFVLNDPTSPGPASKWFEVYSRQGLLGVDYMKSLARQEPVVTRDLRLGATWVAQGKYPFSLALEWSNYEPFIFAGAPVAPLDLEEPTYVTSGSGNLAWIKDGPHPAAAKLFVNWALGREGQQILQSAEKIQSAREDIGVQGLEEGQTRSKTVQYFNANTEEMYKNLEPLKQLAKDIFGPLIR